MTLSKTRWIVRLFFWSLGILDEFTDGDRTWRVEERGTNLCFFFQTTFVLVPLILALHVIVYGGLLAALIAAPIYFFGVGHYAAVIAALVALAALIVGVHEAGAWRRRRREARPRRYDFTPDTRGPTSIGIVWEWLAAQKAKVCPMISFTHGARG